MKLDEMKVQYERSRDGFQNESDFEVKQETPKLKVDASGIAIKLGLCMAVLALAIVIRAFGVGKPEERVAQTSTANSEPTDSDSQQENTIGALHYVETGTVLKWTAPVMSNDIELLRDGQLLRFTAIGEKVTACMAGRVLSVEQDAQLGNCVRIQSEADRETIYYGFETVTVQPNSEVAQGDTLGTVAPGRSIYLKVLENGAPQDPTEYVNLSLGGK